MSTETVIDIISTGVVVGVPWHLTETVVDVLSSATVSASVTVDTESVVDVVSETIHIVDVVSSETIVDIVSEATVKPSPTIGTNTVVDIASTSSVTPSPTISTETVIDIASTAVVVPSPTAAGETIVDITSTSTVAPSPTINTNTVIDIISEGSITTFTTSGATLTAENQTGSTTPAKTTGWVADTATYPGSTIVSNGVQMRGTKTGAKFKFAGPLYWTWSGNVNIAAYVNGVQRGATAVVNIPNAYTEYQRSGEITIDVAAGEIVDLYMWAGQSFGVTRRVGFKYWVE
ncbi:hypothetical protein [Rhodococcus sp. no. 34]